jgi:hypothetical protein
MQNAHERFGSLEFIKRTKDSTTRVRAHIDRTVLETPKDQRGQATAHLVSMIGGDAEIGALWAALTDGTSFHIQLLDGTPIALSWSRGPMLSRKSCRSWQEASGPAPGGCIGGVRQDPTGSRP